MTEQSASQFNGALATGAHSLQKILQGTYSGKISTAKALEGIQTINISVMTAEMVAAEILGVFDFDAKSCNWLRIKRDDMDSIKKLARMTAEGEISEEDVEWQM